MKHRCRVLVLVASVAVELACGSKPKRSLDAVDVPRRQSHDLIVLLPDEADNQVGAATVSNRLGTTELVGARASTSVSATGPPSVAEVIADGEIEAIFSEAFASLPPPPQRFTVHFRFESEELTAESRDRVIEIVAAVRGYPAPEVVVIGHTDTTGTPLRNFQLGLRRAESVRDILVAAGVDPSTIEVTSFGEADPVVRTVDEVSEPKNRRVDITVR